MIFKIFTLAILLFILDKTGKPFLCSGIYGVFVFVFSLVFGVELVDALIITAISTLLASLYFWLLDYFNSGVPYWGILVAGLLIGLI